MKNIQGILIMIGVAIGLYILGRKLQLFSIKISEQLANQIKEAKEFFSTSEYLNPSTHKQSGKGYAVKVPTPTAENWAQNIYDAFPEFPIGVTDVETIYKVFGETGNKMQVSQISDSYQNMFKRDLRNDILNYLRPKELSYLYYIISTKPNS